MYIMPIPDLVPAQRDLRSAEVQLEAPGIRSSQRLSVNYACLSEFVYLAKHGEDDIFVFRKVSHNTVIF